MAAPPLPRRPGALPAQQPPPRIPARPVFPPPAGQPYPPSYAGSGPTAGAAYAYGAPPQHHAHQQPPQQLPRPDFAPPPRPLPPSSAAFAPGPMPALPPRPATQAPTLPNRPTNYGQPAAAVVAAHYSLPAPMSSSSYGSVASSSSRPYIMATVSTNTTNDDSITDLLKDTSKDYLKGIGQGVSALLIVEGEQELTEEQMRLEREREKAHERKENEYIAQQKRRVLEEEEQRRRQKVASGTPPPSATASLATSHQVSFTLTNSQKKDYLGKAYMVYAIDVVWNGASWTVFRRYKQFNDFNSQAKKASFTFAYALPPKKMQGNLKDQFIEQRQRELQKYVQAVSEKAPAMMNNKKSRVALLRFFAPTQVGDKGNNAVLPFDLAELV